MFNLYKKMIQRGAPPYVRIELLNPDETVRKEITNELWDINGNISVSKQDGARRTCSITIPIIDDKKFPLNPSDFWFGTKFKIWAGIVLRGEPYVFPQGVFCLTDPSKVYNPNTRTITLQGTDKWCKLDGTMSGVLNKTFKTMFNQDLKKATERILWFSKYDSIEWQKDVTEVPIMDRLDPKEIIFEGFENEESVTKAIQYTKDGDIIYAVPDADDKDGIFKPLKKRSYELYALKNDGSYVSVEAEIDKEGGNYTGKYNTTNKAATISSGDITIFTQDISRFECPYTSSIEAGKTYADILKEYAKMMMANVYYNADGYLVFKPYSRSLNEVSDYNRPIKWHFTIKEKEMTGLSMNYNFSKVYNDLIVLGNISNGYQAQARLQNRNPASPFSIDKIGLKTKQPYSDTKYYSDKQCRELGTYYAQIEMEMEKSGNITSTPLYHLDVGDIVTITTNQDENREAYLITGYSLPLSPVSTMSITVTNMRYFTNWTFLDSEGNIIDINGNELEKKEEDNNG